MAIKRAHKARIMIGDKWYDIGELSCDISDDTSDIEKTIPFPDGWKGLDDWNVDCTFSISYEDVDRLMGFYAYLFYPNLRYYQWIYRRSMLNPNCMRYKKHLKRYS